MRCFFVDPSQIAEGRALLEGPEARHARTVLRLRPGDAVRLVDGSGWEYAAQVEALPPGAVRFAVGLRRPAPGRPRLRLEVAQGVLKEKKMDRLVRQLAELGAARFTAFACERAVPRSADERLEARRERWRRIAVEALKQCRRGDLMAVETAASLGAVLSRRAAFDRGFFFWERAAAPLALPPPDAPRPAAVLIVLGPEGGFSQAEAEAAAAAGFDLLRLGPRILRAETAALAAAALAQYLFGDLGQTEKNLDMPSEVA
jgi:16S rRNA (uracil1498-N3)-methyltransferase